MTSSSNVILLEGELTIYRAAELKPLLLAALPGTGPIELDLAEVSEVDTAGLQLLMMVQREAPKAGTRLEITGHSKAVTETLALCNLVV